jgi:hypothetical protein
MTRQFLAAACAALLTLAAAPAFAGDAVVAKLAQPVAGKIKFIAGGAMFLCEADSCVANAATSQTFSTAACREVAAKVGVIAAFTGRKPLDESRLADCNAPAVARASGPVLAKQ